LIGRYTSEPSGVTDPLKMILAGWLDPLFLSVSPEPSLANMYYAVRQTMPGALGVDILGAANQSSKPGADNHHESIPSSFK
jgi:hypothetical protein